MKLSAGLQMATRFALVSSLRYYTFPSGSPLSSQIRGPTNTVRELRGPDVGLTLPNF